MTYEEWINATAKQLVDNPDAVTTNTISGKQTDVIELNVDPKDLGKVIGKSGKLAQSMRTLVMAMSTKNGQKVILEIVEPNRKRTESE